MRVVVVQTCAVNEDEIAFYFDKGNIPLAILFSVFFLVRMFLQRFRPEASFIQKGIFAAIIPHWPKVSAPITLD